MKDLTHGQLLDVYVHWLELYDEVLLVGISSCHVLTFDFCRVISAGSWGGMWCLSSTRTAALCCAITCA